MKGSRRLAFVVPRYGPDVIGGVEIQFQEVAHGLAERGWEVEVLTTCARDHFTWADVYPPGVEEDSKVVVRRFGAVVDTPRWTNDDLRVPDLFHHLLDHGDEYRCTFFAPYLFWTTFACAQVHPDRALMPALHDEPQARLELFHPLFAGVRLIWFPDRSRARTGSPPVPHACAAREPRLRRPGALGPRPRPVPQPLRRRRAVRALRRPA
jgi:hypothetical protein